MTTVIIVAIVFGSILALASLICGTILGLATMRRSGLGKSSRHDQTEEAKVIQEIYHGLTRMEARVEALETILLNLRDEKGNPR